MEGDFKMVHTKPLRLTCTIYWNFLVVEVGGGGHNPNFNQKILNLIISNYWGIGPYWSMLECWSFLRSSTSFKCIFMPPLRLLIFSTII